MAIESQIKTFHDARLNYNRQSSTASVNLRRLALSDIIIKYMAKKNLILKSLVYLTIVHKYQENPLEKISYYELAKYNNTTINKITWFIKLLANHDLIEIFQSPNKIKKKEFKSYLRLKKNENHEAIRNFALNKLKIYNQTIEANTANYEKC